MRIQTGAHSHPTHPKKREKKGESERKREREIEREGERDSRREREKEESTRISKRDQTAVDPLETVLMSNFYIFQHQDLRNKHTPVGGPIEPSSIDV